MKINVLWVVVALVAGLALGGWGLRTDLRKVKEDLKKQQAKADKSAKRSAELEGIRTMLRLPENKATNIGDHHGKKSTSKSTLSKNSTTNIVQRPSVRTSLSTTNAPALKHRSMSEEIKKASELWKTRVALARNSFTSNVKLDKDQEDKFDVLLTAMNLRLGDRIEQWTDYLKVKGELNPEDGIRMMNDLSSVMVLTYDELDGSMPQNWREEAGEGFQLFNFIDPEVAMPLAEVEDIISNANPPNQGQMVPAQERTHKPGVHFNFNKPGK
ncbi:MAG: hypothetical protein PHR77_16295 [Kiritimatiellae bacterium]|nr:hypothetical protein [Kiritimatiellia bacterium]MDD5522589.1 hypothetical protein [Kiritimatiellia bacterium]